MRAPKRRVEYLPLASLLPDPANPKAHADAVIEDSIGRFGYIEPVVRDDRTGMIISGHGRVGALSAMEDRSETPPDGVTVTADGVWLMPVITGWASRSDAEAHAALVALNRTTELGGWDQDALLAILDDLASVDGGLVGVGYTDEDMDLLRQQLAEAADDQHDVDPWARGEARPIPDAGEFEEGQIWGVGPHRVGVGDARDIELWRRLLGGARAPLVITEPPAPEDWYLGDEESETVVFTDPPYGVGYTGGVGAARAPIHGDANPDEAALLLDAVLEVLTVHVTRPGTPYYVCLPTGTALPSLMNVLTHRGLYRWMLVWVKDQATFGRADYQQRHEVIAYGWQPGGARYALEDRTQTSVWEVPRPRSSDVHPTSKPVELCAKAILNSSDPGAYVVDPFAGSGSTLIAAAENDRVGIGMEFEPGYARHIVQRLVEVTGYSAVRIDEHE